MKRCTRCGIKKSEELFSFRNYIEGTRSTICKECHSKYRKRHYQDNKGKVLGQVKKWKEEYKKKSGKKFESKCGACGNLIYVTQKDLDEGMDRFCDRWCYLEHNRADGIRYAYRQARKGAQSRSWDFCITEEYVRNLWDRQDGRCAITNVPLIIYPNRVKKKLKNAASIDRIDSTIGYVEGNVQWVLLGINYMKKDYEEFELFDLLDLIVKNYKRE